VRYAAQQRLRDRIVNVVPSVTVSAAYDGPGGYVLIVSSPQVGRLTVRSEADWRRFQARFIKPTSAKGERSSANRPRVSHEPATIQPPDEKSDTPRKTRRRGSHP
jgi:hypothetical protein